jgi:hypothetical protein
MSSKTLLCYTISKDMPDTRLILHVKGTQAETAELPKDVVRDAISKGQLTHSQLIWSPVNNAWKQVRELPELLPGEHLILHVKGTESDTTQLPKQAIRAAISKGQISHSQLIWSSADNAWKQVRELPELLPSQKLAPAPSPIRASGAPVPKAAAAIIPESPNGPVARAAVTASAGMPRVRVATPSAGTPQVRVATASAGTAQVRVATASAGTAQVRAATPSAGTMQVRATAQASAPSNENLMVKEDDASHPLKWVCIGLGILILFVLGANYLLVDHPLVSSLDQTPYSKVKVYAHFGAFMQPNVMVIHIPATSNITPDNLTDFLVALAHSTPPNPITRDFYGRVALTSGWTAQYSFSGSSWKELGDEMGQESEAQRKEFLMAQLGDASGQSIMPESTMNEAAQQAVRDQAWAAFVAHFTAKR